MGLSKHGQARQSKQMRLSRTCMRLLPDAQQERIHVRRYEPEEARVVIRQSASWQRRFVEERGDTFFHLGDEFYLMTGEEVPPTAHYGGFPQVEDGIGITRFFLDELERYLRRSRPGVLQGQGGTVACGTLIAPTMSRAIEEFNRRTGATLKTIGIENRYLGSEINVSGLLGGSDLTAGLRDDPQSGPIFISRTMISDRTGTLLDDQPLDVVARQLGRPIVPAHTMGEVADYLRRHRPIVRRVA